MKLYDYAVLIIFLLLMSSLLTGCKSVRLVEDTKTTYPDGKVEEKTKTLTDDSFTLGGSEGDGKTLFSVNIGNVN